MKRLIRQASPQYSWNIIDDQSMSAHERESGKLAMRIEVSGSPLDPNIIIPEIIPEIQQYLKNAYPNYSIDNITFENFNVENMEKSRRFPNMVYFNFTANFN